MEQSKEDDSPVLPIGKGQLTEIVDMLMDISVINSRSAPNVRSWQPSLTIALALMEMRDMSTVAKHIEDAQLLCTPEETEGKILINMAVSKLRGLDQELGTPRRP